MSRCVGSVCHLGSITGVGCSGNNPCPLEVLADYGVLRLSYPINTGDRAMTHEGMGSIEPDDESHAEYHRGTGSKAAEAEASLAEQARETAKALRNPAVTRYAHPEPVADLLDQLADALTQPAPLIPAAQSLQTIAERHAITAWMRTSALETLAASTRSAPDGSVDDRSAFAAMITCQLAERIDRAAHVPPTEKTEEAEGAQR